MLAEYLQLTEQNIFKSFSSAFLYTILFNLKPINCFNKKKTSLRPKIQTKHLPMCLLETKIFHRHSWLNVLVMYPLMPFTTSLILAALFLYQYEQQLFCFLDWTNMSLCLTCWDKVSKCYIVFIIRAFQPYHTDTSKSIFITNQLTGFSMMKTLAIVYIALHKKWSFPLRISPVSVTMDLVTFTEKILNGKLHFCAVLIKQSRELIFVLFVIAFCMWVHLVC